MEGAGGEALVDFVKLLINERSAGQCQLTSFRLSLRREVRLGHVSVYRLSKCFRVRFSTMVLFIKNIIIKGPENIFSHSASVC